GEYLYFVGCTPYFDDFFVDIGVKSLETSRNSIKILNALGIVPAVLKNERCCGHDLLWTGDVEGFKRLAEHNLAEIEASGAKKVVFSCAEGYRTFKIDIPAHFGRTKFEVLHISELLARPNGLGKIQSVPKKVTFQDPCRLGRHCGIYDEPRKAMNLIPDLTLVEMPRSGQTAICCGTSAWLNCDTNSKRIQKSRLLSSKAVGADMLITSCPKCYIHFTCAMNDSNFGEENKIEVKDLTVLIGEAL
ncbi:(Fe-S)-binding protein, partial [candidate division CSSED10-310 bacterium]